MRARIAALERDYMVDGALFRRQRECADGRAEGAFLAGSFWLAQGGLLGNFPQAFVHAALISAAIDLKGATA